VTVPSEHVSSFASLFAGRTDAYGTGEGRWRKEPVTHGVYRAHLEGRGAGLGIAPLTDDNMVRFAAIDLDEPDFKAAFTMQEFLPGESYVERSRSGNAHVWVFFASPIEGWIPRAILREATVAAGKQHVEVFPKRDRLLPGMLGNYINLPYHGENRPIIWPHPDTCGNPPPPISLEQFLDLVVRNDPDDWHKRARWLGIASPEAREVGRRSEFGQAKQLHVCAQHILKNRDENPVVEGHRAAVYFALARQFANWSGCDDDEALEYMGLVNEASPDPVPDSELRRIYYNAVRGEFTSTGCDDPLFMPYASPDCSIAREAS